MIRNSSFDSATKNAWNRKRPPDVRDVRDVRVGPGQTIEASEHADSVNDIERRYIDFWT